LCRRKRSPRAQINNEQEAGMRLKPASLLLFSFFGVVYLGIASFATAEPINRNAFTLQVASFPDPKSAQEFAARLTLNGVRAICGTVELPGRGVWNRVLVGVFRSFTEARSQGESLVARGLIDDFLVKQIDERADSQSQAPTPRGENAGARQASVSSLHYANVDKPALARFSSSNPFRSEARQFGRGNSAESSTTPELRRTSAETESRPRRVSSTPERLTNSVSPLTHPNPGVGLLLPGSGSRERWQDSWFKTATAGASIPRPEPVRVALDIVAGKKVPDNSARQGGLWLSGDIAEGLARLRWIAGKENADLIVMDRGEKVALDMGLLARLAGVGDGGTTDAMKVVDYVMSNDGLLLLVELIQGVNRYLLHIGSMAPTSGSEVKVSGSINLDNNFDSRINPYRRNQRKLDMERPPPGFEALIAMNPNARWFNLPANRFVPVAHITFHELAEAHAKVQLGLDYLVQEPRAGAHNLAIEREKLLKHQRPLADVVLTAGSNRVLKLGEEMRRFYAETRRPIAGLN
jgi:hypothetical protein